MTTPTALKSHPVERVRNYCRTMQGILDEHSEELTDGLVKALSDVLMKMHQEAPEWQSWQADPHLERMELWVDDELDSDFMREEERRKRARQAERRRLVLAGDIAGARQVV